MVQRGPWRREKESRRYGYVLRVIILLIGSRGSFYSISFISWLPQRQETLIAYCTHTNIRDIFVRLYSAKWKYFLAQAAKNWRVIKYNSLTTWNLIYTYILSWCPVLTVQRLNFHLTVKIYENSIIKSPVNILQ